jgi:hypothetical protein
VSEITRELSDLAGQWIVKQTVVTVNSNTAGVQLCQANPLRWELLLQINGGGLSTNWGFGLSADATVNGYNLMTNTSSPFRLNFRQSGGLVSQAWYGFAPSGSAEIVVTELIMQQ